MSGHLKGRTTGEAMAENLALHQARPGRAVGLSVRSGVIA